MPTQDLGYSAAEVIQLLKLYVGNKSTDFESYVSYELPLAEFRYSKRHDWSFLYKENLSLAIVDGTAEYVLNHATIGFYMAASDVIVIRDEAMNRVLRKTTIDDIRRMDPNNDDGENNNSGPIYWAPAGDNRIVVYPRIFSTTTLKVDGKITPFSSPSATVQGLTYTGLGSVYNISVRYVVAGNNTPLSVAVSSSNAITVNLATDGGGVATSTAANVLAAIQASSAASVLVSITGTGAVALVAQPTTRLEKYFSLPYRYQNSFIEWLKGIALDRESDTRAGAQLGKADSLIDQDIEDDLTNLGDTILPRIKATWEQYFDGASNNLEQMYLLWMFYGNDY